MQDKIERIHTTAMGILEKVGIKIHLPEICTLLKKNGIKMDDQVAYFREGQVMRWVHQAPSKFTLHARNPEHNALIGGGRPQYAAGYGCAEVVDAVGRRHMASLTDYVRLVQLVHLCEGFHINGGILVQPAELAADQTHLAMTYATLLYSDKCIMGQPGSAAAVEKIMTLAAMVFGGRHILLEKPRGLGLVNTLSPLQLDRMALETISVHAQHGQALLIAAGVMSGTTAPITTAGSLAQGTAEALAAIAISQMVREGTPVVMGLVIAPADMSTGEVRLGVPAHAASYPYIRALADRYDLPCRCGGSVTDATGLTHQSGYESLLNMLVTRQSGVDLILHSAGILDSFRAMSVEKFISDLEIIRIVDHYLAGVALDEDSLALSVIEDVGPGGEFLTHAHTLAHCRDVPFRGLLNKAGKNGKALTAQDGYLARVASTLENMMSAYHQPDLAPGLQADMESYLIAEGVDAVHIETINKVQATPIRRRLPT